MKLHESSTVATTVFPPPPPPAAAAAVSSGMYSTSPHALPYGSPQNFRTSPRPPYASHASPTTPAGYYYGINQKLYQEPAITVYPPPPDQPDDFTTEPFSRQRNVAFQQDYYCPSRGSYSSTTPRRCGNSPRGSHISPKFRRTPGASRPNSCGPTFALYDSQVQQQQQQQQSASRYATQSNGSTGGRNTPAYGSRSSSSCSNNPPSVHQYFQPIRTPPSPVMTSEPRSRSCDLRAVSCDLEFEESGIDGEQVDDIELMVSNLDYNISAREWKKILYTEFQQQIQVQGVYIQTQADNTNIGFVRVGSIDEARYAISQFHRKKIGYKRIHVALVNHDSGVSFNNTKVEVQALLREVTGHRLPLFKFIELFEKRYHRSISVSELYRLRDVVDIQGDSGDGGGGGRMVLLTSPGGLGGSSGGVASGGSSPVARPGEQQVDDGSSLESPVCRQHCKEGSMNYMDALDLCCLPNVVLLLKSFAPQVHTLLQLHEGCMPIMSFPACYAAEFAELKTTTKGGVPLEHMISCVPGVQVIVSKSGIKKVQWAENKLPSQMIEFGRFCTSPLMNQQLGQFSREVVDLLKTCPQCKMTFSKFIPNYHHHFGRQCRVADYGYTKLMELFEAIPHVVQILGGGSRRFVTLSHRAQVKRFTSDILRVLKSQASKQINITDMPIIYNRVVGKLFDITDYGVCYIEDMLAELPEATVLVTGAGDRMNLAIPRREQTSEEIERTRQFSLEVVDLLKHSPQCRMPFNKFIPSYHHHFGKQCRVSDYGFTKLIELFESIPNIVQLLDEQDEKLLALTESELVKVLEEQVSSLLRSWPNQIVPMSDFLAAYMKQFGHSLRLQDFGVASVPELITKISNTATIEAHEGELVISLVDHSYVEQLARRVLLILMEVETGQMSLRELDVAHSSMFGLKLSSKELREELQGVVQVTDNEDEERCLVKLCPLQQFARDARSLLRRHQGRLALAGFEAAYAEHYGVALSPAAYGYPSTAALLQAIPHVANIRGKGYRRTVLLCHDFHALVGKMMGLSPPPTTASNTDANTNITASSDSGITEPSHEEGESSGEHLFLASRGPSPFDLLAGVPSTVPSPDLQPQPLDLMRFEPTPPPCDVLNSLSDSEKLGQKTPLCKTPVSEMLQFAAQLLPTNPPVVPPSATPVDILQNHLQATSYTAAFYQYQQCQQYPGDGYSIYGDSTQYDEYLSDCYGGYQHINNSPQEYYPPPIQSYGDYQNPTGYYTQAEYPATMVPPPCPERRHTTPGTPSSANLSVLGKRMAELVLETPSSAETSIRDRQSSIEEDPKEPKMQLDKQLNKDFSTTPIASDNHLLRSSASASNLPTHITRVPLHESAASLPSSPRAILGPSLLKWPSEGTAMNQALKSPSTKAKQRVEESSPVQSASPSPRRCRIAAKFSIPLAETPPRSDSSNY